MSVVNMLVRSGSSLAVMSVVNVLVRSGCSFVFEKDKTFYSDKKILFIGTKMILPGLQPASGPKMFLFKARMGRPEL